MAIVESTALEPSTAFAPTAARTRPLDRFKPRWRTSLVPWVIAGGLGLAAVVTALAAWSLNAGTPSPAGRPGSIAQFCQDIGGTAGQCANLTLPQASTPAGSASSGSVDS